MLFVLTVYTKREETVFTFEIFVYLDTSVFVKRHVHIVQLVKAPSNLLDLRNLRPVQESH